ncbi:hypothetical protein B0T25DRAFT_603228 [Lasiosphaeria hispida]|uniref:Uncharacterized protein n=1 Tax=Lasiosphaeria hispida TaxID=260671 RepID=A0AAJ0HKR3_9PEZI|nr:hypothetical protein B0T25DRAFT_603228 [Lasiosphaeria hispida]
MFNPDDTPDADLTTAGDKGERERKEGLISAARHVLSRRTPNKEEMWAEITKDLVVREAIEERVFNQKHREDVQQLVQLSNQIRQALKDRHLENEYAREYPSLNSTNRARNFAGGVTG